MMEADLSATESGPLWHTLKTEKNDDALEELRRLGHETDVEIYVKLWDRAPEAAKEFARSKQEEESGESTRTFVGSRRERMIVNILLVDDEDSVRERVKSELDRVNGDISDFKFKLRVSRDTKSAKDALVGRELHAVILDYLLPERGRGEGDESKASIELSRIIAKVRPDLPVFGLTGFAPRLISDREAQKWRQPVADWVVERVFYKNDAAEIHELILAILRSIRERWATPFFSALKTYSELPTAVFHALPLSRSKSVATSQWTEQFYRFYGEHYFAAETSSTMAPLDSIFGPKRSLRTALEMAARAFHAERSLFVTNGTTGANSIVYRALVHPGDVVLLDRNCHRSHHYAALQSSASVVYMEPEHIDTYGISSRVSIDTIENTVKAHKDARLLALTHPTFDGVCYDPYEVMRRVHAINPEIVFLFDEAWIAYAAFHPSFRKFSAMIAAEKLWADDPRVPVRVYVTQSTHKTLSALRQGSMIHIRDPLLKEGKYEDILNLSLEEAQIAFTTTSPNIHILASLDVARMQAELEGYDLLSRALEISQWVRDSLKDSKKCRALTAENLQTERLRTEGHDMLDPLKITIEIPTMSGGAFREEYLYRKCGIQVNKTSQNTVLALITIGTTFSMADHLIRSLKAWEPESAGGRIQSFPKLPRFTKFTEQFCTVEGAGNLSGAYHCSLIPGKASAARLGESGPSDAIDKVSAVFVTPYPPGYPILVPGQVIDTDCVEFLRALRSAGVDEIHGLQKRDPASHTVGDYLWVMQ